MMKKIITVLITVLIVGTLSIFVDSCVTTSKIADKSSTQLWGENCSRCHNTPPSSAFSNDQWETIDMHMSLRANITAEESKKILQFLQSGN